MLSFFKKGKKSLEELRAEFDAAFQAGDQAGAVAALEALKACPAREPEEQQQHQDITGWAILCMIGQPFDGLGEFIQWHVDQYPHSLSPVRVEYAANMANQGQDDTATYFARDYLHDVRRAGALRQLARLPIVQRGTSQAFLLLSAAYVRVGARAYNLRLFEHALKWPLLPEFTSHLERERQREIKELQDAQHARINGIWEAFYAGQGAGTAAKLMQWCDRQQCPLMARRVELLDLQFRTDSNFRADEREFYGQVVREGSPDGPYHLRFAE